MCESPLGFCVLCELEMELVQFVRVPCVSPCKHTPRGAKRGRCGSALRKAVEFVRVSVTEAVCGFVYACVQAQRVFFFFPSEFQRRLKPPDHRGGRHSLAF